MDVLEQDFDFILSTIRRVHPAYTQDSHMLDSAAAFLKQRYLGKEEAQHHLRTTHCFTWRWSYQSGNPLSCEHALSSLGCPLDQGRTDSDAGL